MLGCNANTRPLGDRITPLTPSKGRLQRQSFSWCLQGPPLAQGAQLEIRRVIKITEGVTRRLHSVRRLNCGGRPFPCTQVPSLVHQGPHRSVWPGVALTQDFQGQPWKERRSEPEDVALTLTSKVTFGPSGRVVCPFLKMAQYQPNIVHQLWAPKEAGLQGLGSSLTARFQLTVPPSSWLWSLRCSCPLPSLCFPPRSVVCAGPSPAVVGFSLQLCRAALASSPFPLCKLVHSQKANCIQPHFSSEPRPLFLSPGLLST